MDKVKVNNQVVKMRKHVKRAKLFTINKFTKQLKRLQNKKGNESQAEKNQRKVERLLEKVKILKKMMPDFVSKKALSKAQDWNALLTQKNIPLEDQCLALLANDTEVQKEVEKFHAEECQLAEKIPTLLLEWEIKSKMPKLPDKTKKASDIKKQKLDKIAKRKKSNFKGATFPNNVAVDKKLKVSDKKKRVLSDRVAGENFNDNAKNDRNQSESPEPMEADLNENDELKSEFSNDSGDDESGEFFTKPARNVKKQRENPEPMDGDSDENDQLNSESYDNSSDGESECFTNAAKSKKCFFSKKRVKNNASQLIVNSPSNDNASEEEENPNSKIDNIKNSFVSKIDSNKDSTSSRPSIFERLTKLAQTDTKKLKTKNSKSNLSSQNTKAIKVLDLNELQGADQIPIQNISVDSEDFTPHTVVPKKDSFFLNGDEEVVSSSDNEANVNNYKNFQPKRKLSNFVRNERDGKFKKNHFGDKSRKSFGDFKEKDFSQTENRFQNRKGKDFNKKEDRFHSRKGKDFNRSERRFQKGKDFNQKEDRFQNRKGKDFNPKESRFQKGNSQFQSKFDNNSKWNPHQFKQSNPAKMNDSMHPRRESKKQENSFQSRKLPNEKEEKNVQLHPSWEAKQKLKEAAKSGFKGKRIVFD